MTGNGDARRSERSAGQGRRNAALAAGIVAGIVAAGCISDLPHGYSTRQYQEPGSQGQEASWRADGRTHVVRVSRATGTPEHDDELNQWPEARQDNRGDPPTRRQVDAPAEPPAPPPDPERTARMLEDAQGERDPQRQRRLLGDVIRILERQVVETPDHALLHHQLGNAYLLLASLVLPDVGRFAGTVDLPGTFQSAETHLRRAARLAATLDDSSQSIWLRVEIARSLSKLFEAQGSLAWRRRDLEEARRCYALGRDALRTLTAAGDSPMSVMRDLSVLELKYADACWHLGHVEEADTIYDAAYERILPLVARSPQMRKPAAGLAAAYMVLGQDALSRSRPARAVQILERAWTLWPFLETLYRAQGLSLEDRAGARLTLLMSLSVAHWICGAPDPAGTTLDAAEACAGELGGARRPTEFVSPPVPDARFFAAVRAAYEATASANPPSREGVLALAEGFHAAGRRLSNAGFQHAAYGCLLHARQMLAGLDGEPAPDVLAVIVGVLGAVADVADRLERPAEARRAMHEAIRLGEELVADDPGREDVAGLVRGYRQRLRFLSLR